MEIQHKEILYSFLYIGILCIWMGSQAPIIKTEVTAIPVENHSYNLCQGFGSKKVCIRCEFSPDSRVCNNRLEETVIIKSRQVFCPRDWVAANAWHEHPNEDDKFQRCIRPTKEQGVIEERYFPIK